MRVAAFSTPKYDGQFLDEANQGRHEFAYYDVRLASATAPLAAGYAAICAFVNDQLSEEPLAVLRTGGTRLLALRSAGFNHVDLPAADRLGSMVARVSAYSPYALALMMSLNRRTFRAYNRVREGNFSLEGLLGFALHGKAVGVVGSGKIV